MYNSKLLKINSLNLGSSTNCINGNTSVSFTFKTMQILILRQGQSLALSCHPEGRVDNLAPAAFVDDDSSDCESFSRVSFEDKGDFLSKYDTGFLRPVHLD